MIDAAPSLKAAEGISGPELAAYLVANGWSVRPSRVDGISIFTMHVHGSDQPVEFILPVKPGFDDERRRIADALRVISAIEGRREANIADDIQRDDRLPRDRPTVTPIAAMVDPRDSSTPIKLIVPDQLEADAVVPQCLDNQFVSEQTFEHMVANEVGYDDPTVQAMREIDTKNEFVRSLIYSSQVILNRAYMRNNEYIYKHFMPDSPDLSAAATLARGRVMIPYLFEESTLLDDVAWDKRPAGDQAMATLLDATGGNITCLRFALDDEINKEATTILAQSFRNYLVRLRHYDKRQRNILAEELRGRNRSFRDDAEWSEFNRRLNALADYAYHADNLKRHDIYQDFINKPRSNTSEGHFRGKGNDASFLFEIKKLVDLIYNTTLPDSLRRFTFTPVDLPSRAALQDQINLAAKGVDWRKGLPDNEVLDFIRRQFMAQTQNAMTLPLLAELTMADIVEIRRIDEWEAFRLAQTAILNNPLAVHELLPKFSEAFEQFQRELSTWYRRKYADAETQERYANFVTFLLQLGGRTIIATHAELHGFPHVIADTVLDEAAAHLPKRVKGITAKLLMGVYNVGKAKLDKQRSYTIELMRSNQEVMREEIADIYHRFVNRDQGQPLQVDQMADQGKQ
jgi:hypothetical protein